MDWTVPVVSVLVALIAASGAWLTVNATRAAARLKREDALQKRNLRIINYAQELRDVLSSRLGKDEKLPPWPDNLFDE
ncbi:MAG: hypothetical protein AB7T06_24790 [Kofleriaceae bacterium]